LGAFKRRCKLNQHAYPFDTVSQKPPTHPSHFRAPFLKGIVYQDSGRGFVSEEGLTSGALQNGVHIANDRKKKNWVRVSGTVTANGGNGKWKMGKLLVMCCDCVHVYANLV